MQGRIGDKLYPLQRDGNLLLDAVHNNSYFLEVSSISCRLAVLILGSIP